MTLRPELPRRVTLPIYAKGQERPLRFTRARPSGS
jgi:hypothetical protein